jgi:flagellar biogenesis protein FliO
VLGLIFLLRWGLNRLSGRVSAASHSAMLEVLGRVKVAPRSNVLLIRLGHRLLIVSESTAGLSTLANIDDPEEVATLLRASSVARPHGATSAFSSLLRRFSIEHRNADRIATEGNDSDEYHVDRARDQVSGLLARVRNTISSGGPR